LEGDKWSTYKWTQKPTSISNTLLIDLFLRRRYGLLGPNGCGKSTLLKAIVERDIPIPKHIE